MILRVFKPRDAPHDSEVKHGGQLHVGFMANCEVCHKDGPVGHFRVQAIGLARRQNWLVNKVYVKCEECRPNGSKKIALSDIKVTKENAGLLLMAAALSGEAKGGLG